MIHRKRSQSDFVVCQSHEQSDSIYLRTKSNVKKINCGFFFSHSTHSSYEFYKVNQSTIIVLVTIEKQTNRLFLFFLIHVQTSIYVLKANFVFPFMTLVLLDKMKYSSVFTCLVISCLIFSVECLFMRNVKDKIKKLFVNKTTNSINETTRSYEEMMLFPNIGFQRADGYWRLNCHGWRFQLSKRNKFFGESSSSLGERLARLFASSEQIVYFNDTFQRDRLKPFMVQDKQHEQILIIIGENHNFTTTTDDEGQFRRSFIISNEDIQQLKQISNNNQILPYLAVGDNGDTWEGKIHLLERQGLSIVSDIDDTIKISEVIDKIRLIANTFIHSFRVVEG